LDRGEGRGSGGRNPGSATPVMVQSILAIAFAEAIVFYTLFLVK
jgi:F-type H+-transporting ATPase subunit c